MVYLLLPIVKCTYIEIYFLDVNSTILSPHVKNAEVLKAIKKADSRPWSPKPPPRQSETVGPPFAGKLHQYRFHRRSPNGARSYSREYTQTLEQSFHLL